MSHGDALTSPAGRDAHQVGGEGGVEGARLGGEQSDQCVVGRLGRGRFHRGAARGVDLGEVGRERSVDGVDRIEDRYLFNGQVAGRHEGIGLHLADGVQGDLVPMEDHVAREQAAVLQEFEAGPARRLRSGPVGGGSGRFAPGAAKKFSEHDRLPFGRWSAIKWRDIVPVRRPSAGAVPGR